MAHGELKDGNVIGRNFAFVQLIENLPENWEKKVEDLLLPVAWVVHDKDRYTEDDEKVDPERKAGMLKKPHVHFFVYFSGKRSANGVVALFHELNINYVERIECKNAYLAYMLHLRQEDKYTYPYDAMVIKNGLKVNFADLANVDFGDVLDFAEKYNVTKFSELVQVAKRHDPPIFRYVNGHYGLVCAYFADLREG